MQDRAELYTKNNRILYYKLELEIIHRQFEVTL